MNFLKKITSSMKTVVRTNVQVRCFLEVRL